MRSARMFEIIQLLRSLNRPCTAQEIADYLEVTKRTIYRDIASLQAMRVPIEGEAGIGYVMRPGYDLPPVNFDVEEAEAISVGLSMISRTGDKGLVKASHRVMSKLSEAAALSEILFCSSWGAETPEHVDLSAIRQAVREELKVELIYRDGQDQVSNRLIRPIALVYYYSSVVIVGWCELRDDFRHFRSDRIVSAKVQVDRFAGEGKMLRRDWEARQGAEF